MPNDRGPRKPRARRTVPKLLRADLPAPQSDPRRVRGTAVVPQVQALDGQGATAQRPGETAWTWEPPEVLEWLTRGAGVILGRFNRAHRVRVLEALDLDVPTFARWEGQ